MPGGRRVRRKFSVRMIDGCGIDHWPARSGCCRRPDAVFDIEDAHAIPARAPGIHPCAGGLPAIPHFDVVSDRRDEPDILPEVRFGSS